MNKAEFRKRMLEKLSSPDNTLSVKDTEKIYESFLSLSEYAAAKRVFAYVGVGNEIQTMGLIDKMLADGKEVCVPLCFGKGQMDARRISSEKDLSSGRYGIPEPAATLPVVAPEELELIIVPGVAFGEDGTRLGRGGGYYDRFLSRAENAARIALARELNTEKTVPCEEHDEKVDIIVTEARVIKTKVR